MKEFSELTDIMTQNFKWHKARKDTLILLLCAILVRQTANLSKLAEYFPDVKAVKEWKDSAKALNYHHRCSKPKTI